MRFDKLSIDDVVDLLVRDRVVVKAFRDCYGDDAPRFLREIQHTSPSEFDEADPHVHDLLVETLANDARLYVRFLGIGSEAGNYHIDIMGLGGVYFVRASEFDDHGLFGTLDDAESWVRRNWMGNLASFGRTYREPFSPAGKDSAPSPRPSARRKTDERKADGHTKPVRFLLPAGVPSAEQLAKLFFALTGKTTSSEEIQAMQKDLDEAVQAHLQKSKSAR